MLKIIQIYNLTFCPLDTDQNNVTFLRGERENNCLINFKLILKLWSTNKCQISFNFLKYIYYLLLAALGLRCCTGAFSSCGERGLLFVVVRGFLIVVASLVVEHGL